jgi:uncharacterized protein with GYD domain
MAKYLVVARYNADGMKGICREGGGARRSTVADIVKNLGGELESFYFAFGENDVYSVIDLPNNVSAAAMAMHISASGTTRIDVTVLLTPEEVDKAARTEMFYRPPGT